MNTNIKKEENSSDNHEIIFLSTLFQELNRDGVPYAVMRNYESLPYSANGSDLDLMVSFEYGAGAKKAVLRAVRICGGAPIGVLDTANFFQIHAIGSVPYRSSQWWGLRVDVYIGGVFYKGTCLFSANNPLPVDKKNGIRVFKPSVAGIIAVLKMFHLEVLPIRYMDLARKAVLNNWHQIKKILTSLQPNEQDKLRELLLDDKTDGNRAGCVAFRRMVLRRTFFRRPLFFLWRRLSYEWTKTRRFFNPSGVVIAVLGVDGAGKSTLINAISPILREATHDALFVHHLRPSLLPPLARLKGKKLASGETILEPHGSAPSGAIGSLLRLAYYTLDYVLGYWLKVRPKIAKQPAVVLFDRYAYDMILDPRRFRMSIPGSVARWFTSIIPKPDLIMCLHAAPEAVAARKQELPIDEIRRQVDDLMIFSGKERRASLIANEGSIAELRENALRVFFNFVSLRRDSNRS